MYLCQHGQSRPVDINNIINCLVVDYQDTPPLPVVGFFLWYNKQSTAAVGQGMDGRPAGRGD